MVKVKDDLLVMAEPKTPSSGANYGRKGRVPHYHHHTPFTHHPFHHCTYASVDVAEANGTNSGSGGATSPASFYIGPGFQPQNPPTNTQLESGVGGAGGGSAVEGGNGGDGSYTAGPSQGHQHIVHFHVNPGVIINFQMGDTVQILRGPVTVPMVSTNSSPPVAMPVQVPPGHVVQQIVDETGTLRHVIISPQHPPGVLIPPHNAPHYSSGPPNGTNQGPQGPMIYSHGVHGLHYTTAHHYHSNMPPGPHLGHPPPTAASAGHSPPPPTYPAYYKDERTHRQHSKLRKKLQDKQLSKGGAPGAGGDADVSTPMNGLRRTHKEKGMNSVGTSEDGEESSSVQDEEDSMNIITDILSSVQAPKVSELTSRSALLQWAPPLRLSEAASSDSHDHHEINENDLRYEVLLSSDRSKEQTKYKSIYSGESLSCRIQDLKPGQEYTVCLQVHLDELQGTATDPIKFTTPPCEPDQPQPPKLVTRTKNSLQLRWNAVNDNGSHIQHYILEYDEGKSNGMFVEVHKTKGKHHNLRQLNAATCYQFRLAATNEVGKSLYSDSVIYTTSENAPTTPKPPTLVTANVNSLHLQWEKRPEDHNFVLQMNEHTYGFMTVYNGKDTSYVCNNLTRFSDYMFRLRAQNDGGDSNWSPDVRYQTLPDRPARPNKPIVKGRIHAHSFRLRWDPVQDTGGAAITNYFLELNSGSGYRTVYTGAETEATCDKLTPGTTYQLRVSCESAGGHSNYSDPCTVTTDAVTPSECLALKLHGKPKATSLTVRWNSPDYDGGAPILEYELTTSIANSGTDTSRNLVWKSKECETTVTDLTPGTEYVFSVRAVNRVGPGQWSAPATMASGAAPPDSPENLTVISRSPTHVTVSWTEPRDNGAPVKEYRLEMSPAASSKDDGGVQQPPIEDQFLTVFQGQGLSSDVKYLIPSTIYYFRLQASNSAGYGPYGPIVEIKTPPAPPSTISLTVTEVTPTSVHITWTEPECYGCPVTHYNIEVSDRPYTVEAPDTEFLIEHLTPETYYKIKIQAVNEVGIGPYTTVKLTTAQLPPAAPRLECIGTSHNHLKLKWGDGKNQDYTTYCLEMENARMHGDFQCVFKGTALTFKVNKLQEMTTYRFRINATNDAGEGDFSELYEFTTSIAPPAAVKPARIVEVEERHCVLEWGASRSNTSDTILYVVQVAKSRDQEYKQVYKGTETTCSVDNLDPGAEYHVRVLPIRVTETKELPGPLSPTTTFRTLAQEQPVAAKPQSSVSGTPVHSTRHRPNHGFPYFNSRAITPQQKVFLKAVLTVIFFTIISMVIGNVAIK